MFSVLLAVYLLAELECDTLRRKFCKFCKLRGFGDKSVFKIWPPLKSKRKGRKSFKVAS